jgi:adenosylhomocysteine nucleosidase
VFGAPRSHSSAPTADGDALKRLGIVAAMPLERSWLTSTTEGVRPAVEVCGVGAAGARRAALRLADLGVDVLASWGMAAGLDPQLAPGTVVIPTRVIGSPAARGYTPDVRWRQRLLDRLGHAVTVCGDPIADAPAILDTPDAKAAIFERTGAVAADMESAAVAQVAAANELPLLVIRVVLDAAAVSLPGGLGRVINDAGRVRVPQLMIRTVFDPRDWPRWSGLVRYFLAARHAMRTVWSLTAPDLALSDKPAATRDTEN